MPFPAVSVVIPAINEARNIPHVLARLPASLHEVVLADGDSADGTVSAARRIRPDVRVVTQSRRGKGNALACGLAAASGDVIATVDADGSTDPAEIPRFLEALMAGADFAKGTRFAPGGRSCDADPLRNSVNRALTTLFNVVYGSRYTDLCYGFNVFWRRCVPVLGLDAAAPAGLGGTPPPGDGFEVEALIHARAARAGLRVAEVPSSEHPRLHGEDGLRARDGLRVLRTILAESRGPGRRLAVGLAPACHR